MSASRLQDDLLQGFHEEKTLIREQLELLDPLAVSLRQPAAQRLLNKGLLILFEAVCYLLSVVSAAAMVMMNRILPFHLLQQPGTYTETAIDVYTIKPQYLPVVVGGLLGLIVILLFTVGRILRRVRLKNDILHLAGKHIKTLVGQHLKRKAAMDAIEQRHFRDFTGKENTTIISDDTSWKLEDRLG